MDAAIEARAGKDNRFATNDVISLSLLSPEILSALASSSYPRMDRVE
jgi:hypothetical protein